MADIEAAAQAATQPSVGKSLPGADARLPAFLRQLVRTREVGLVAVSLAIGALSGLLVYAVGFGVQAMHVVLFALAADERLSASETVASWRIVVVPLAGGVVVALLALVGRRMGGRLADAIEANALYGGKLSVMGSVLVTIETMASCGFGASVGLEAGYAQICAAAASRLGLALSARRADLRLLVACGAAGAISAAFEAPLAGAFYGFEVVLGTYTVAALAPVAGSALVANLLIRALTPSEFLIAPNSMRAVTPPELGHVVVIAVACALLGILLMHAVSGFDTLLRWSRLPRWARPPLGGLIVGLFGLVTPQVLGAGHGAMGVDLVASITPTAIMIIILFKGAASAVSLGSGFRGGLFYASLLIGALVGRLYVDGAAHFGFFLHIDPDLAALTGMAAFGTGVIGAPVTMTALALETTGNFSVTVAALIGSAIASVIVRELFGYSFATWRFHLRGEAIRGPHDIGWMRDLAVKKLMRSDVKTAPAALSIREARQKFPLGADKQIVAVETDGSYAGLILLEDLYTAPEETDQPLGALVRHKDEVLYPWMQVREALQVFQKVEADSLVVVDHQKTRGVLGLLTEAHALRRYREELERQSPDILGSLTARPEQA